MNAGDIDSAIDQLLSLLAKVDGEDPPPDWMLDSFQKEYIAAIVDLLIELLML